MILSSVDMNVLRMDDIYQRETQNRLVLHNLDWRLQRLEELNMNMYQLMQKMFDNQSPQLLRSSSFCAPSTNDDRRRSSLSPYKLHQLKGKSLLFCI